MASTPKRSRCSSMSAIISSWGGRVPERKNRLGLEDLVPSVRFGKLARQTRNLLLPALPCMRWWCLVALAVAFHPQGFLSHADPRGDGPDRVQLRASLCALAFEDHPHGAPTQFGGVLLG